MNPERQRGVHEHTEFRPEERLHIAFPFQGRWVRKVFVRGLGIPRQWVYAVLRTIKSCLMPTQVRTRVRAAKAMIVEDSELDAFRRAGHRPVLSSEVGNLDAVLAPCREIQRLRLRQLANRDQQDKAFLHYIAAGQDFLDHAAVIHFALSEPIVRAVSAYLGTVPVLASISLLWSPPSPPGTQYSSSQRFHNDHEDVTQIKLFVHVDDVDSDHGVFTFHSASATEKIREALGTRRGRLDDADVRKIVPDNELIKLVGPAGSAHFVDTSRCLHFGSRPSAKGRLVLQMQYLRCNSPTYSNLAVILNEHWAAESWTPIQRMVLGLRAPAPN